MLRSPHDAVKRGQPCYVKVLSTTGQKISLSMKDADQRTGADLNPNLRLPGQPSAASATANPTRAEAGVEGRRKTRDDDDAAARPLKRLTSPELFEAKQLIASGVLDVRDYPQVRGSDRATCRPTARERPDFWRLLSQFDETVGLMNVEATEEEVEIELNEAEPLFLRGQASAAMPPPPSARATRGRPPLKPTRPRGADEGVGRDVADQGREEPGRLPPARRDDAVRPRQGARAVVVVHTWHAALVALAAVVLTVVVLASTWQERRELRESQQRALMDSIPKDLNRPWEDPMPEPGERHIAQELRGLGYTQEAAPEWKLKTMGKGVSFGFPSRNKSIMEQRVSLPIYSLKQELINAVTENQARYGRDHSRR